MRTWLRRSGAPPRAWSGRMKKRSARKAASAAPPERPPDTTVDAGADLPAGEAAAPTVPPDVPGIVGIGASAGGLDAFTRLLHGLERETGLAYVLVQHLSR